MMYAGWWALQRGNYFGHILRFPERKRRIIRDEVIADRGLFFQRRGFRSFRGNSGCVHVVFGCSSPRGEAIDTAVVGTDHNFSIHDRWRTADRLADFVGPKFFAVLQRHDVNPAIVRADDNLVAD